MRRSYLVIALLLGLLVAGRVGTRVWGSEAEPPAGYRPVSSFIMTIEGDSGLTAAGAKVVVGEAAYGRRSSKEGGHFSLELGSTSHQASMILSAEGLGPLGPGIYPVDDRPGSPALHGLIVTGSPSRPTGVYRAQSGRVTVHTIQDGQLEGNFEMWARGFNATNLMDENLTITVAGSFVATER